MENFYHAIKSAYRKGIENEKNSKAISYVNEVTKPKINLENIMIQELEEEKE